MSKKIRIISAFSSHKKQIENWIKGGGRLYVSIYGSHESTLNWLPDDLVVTSDKIGVTKYDILVNNDIVAASVQSVQNENAGFFTSSNGYTSLISAKTNDMVAPILISRTYGAGEITLSNGEFEKGFHPEVIEPLFVITGTVIAIFVAKMVISYVISEYIVKPKVVPILLSNCREQKITFCDDEWEADLVVGFASDFAMNVGIKAVAREAAKSFGTSAVMHWGYLTDPNKYWGAGLSNATSIQINQSYRGTSLNYELEVHNLTIVDTSVSMPIITSPDESTLFVLEQGKAQQGLIQIRNDGNVQTSVNIGLNNTTRLPAGSENIDASWFSLNSDTFQLKARETKNITFEVNVPLTAAYKVLSSLRLIQSPVKTRLMGKYRTYR